MPAAAKQEILYDQRFLAKHTGSIMLDPIVALMELVANAWDAYATTVKIDWPNAETGSVFSITDNGHGMTEDDFNSRWKVLNYDRVRHQGDKVQPPSTLHGARPRTVYGRNGMGRHAMFCFDPVNYIVRTWKNGTETTIEVSRPQTSDFAPFHCKVLERKTVNKKTHGTQISASAVYTIPLTPDMARDAIGTRFLADPTFEVHLNGKRVSFAQIADPHLKKYTLAIPDLVPPIEVSVIDPGTSDRTTRQKGLAWWVGNRLVGDCTWENLDGRKLLDGRSHDAKRYTIVIQADAMRDAVAPDWDGFDHSAKIWKRNAETIGTQIGGILDDIFREKREQRQKAIMESLRATRRQLTAIGRERADAFIAHVMKQCPSFTDNDLKRLADILTKLELAQSQYSLLRKLHQMGPEELDGMDEILEDWSVATAKIVLSTIQERLSVLEALKRKMYVTSTDEVHELQPLIARGLWMFGAEFESIEFTSNRAMTAVIQQLFKKDEVGSRNRPDFVILPDSSIALYSRPGYDQDHKDVEAERVVIVELKRPGIAIGRKECDQAEEYFLELEKKGCLRDTRRVDAFILGSELDSRRGRRKTIEGPPTLCIEPMRYDRLAEMASKRMMHLDRQVRMAPFLNPDEILRFLDPDADTPELQLQLAPVIV